MEEFLSPVFNIECEDEEDHDVQPEVQEIKSPKFDHLHKLLSDRSLSLPRHNSNAILKKLKAIAEDNLLKKDLKETCCSLPGNPRSTFLMVFSSDGSKVASSHGDHNINVTDLRTNKCISTLSGHPRTPWCIAFHPHRNDILASGCLGGQVRVWDLHGGSEMWSVTATEVTTVIASLAFHPSERLLVIATNSTLYFWDWNIPQPFAKCSTANEKQKLRYVSFDPLGNWLLTGISNTPASVHFPVTGATSMPHLSAPSTIGAAQAHIGDPVTYRVERNEQERERNLQSRYQTLLDQYERLRVRYQELRHRAAELELNASTSQSTGTFNEAAAVEPSTSRSSPSVDSSLMSASSSDRFWQTLMNAAENLRALSNIGRSLNNPPQSMSGGESSTSRQAGPSLDQDARMRIQLLSRHIENMQRICRSHLEMTRHRRQVYRLQQIRRILEDLREQIRYLQVCVRDSLDLVSRMRTSPSPQAGTSNNSGSSLPSVERPSQPVAANHANLRVDLQFNTGGRIALESRLYSPVQCRRFANYLVGRLCRIGLQHHREHSRLRRNFVAGRDARHSYRRFSLRPQGVSPSSFNPVDHVDHVDSYPGTSRDFPLGIDEDLELDEAPTLERRFNPGNLMGWRRARSTRMGRRYMSRSNSLLHVRCLGVQRRKASLLSRISYGRTLQSQMRSVANRMPTAAVDAASTSVPQSSHDSGQRPGDQSLRPLMERLESHFRLQRQTMGILAQLNEAAATSTSTNEIASSSMTGSREGAASASASFSDSGVSSRPWASNVLHSIRHWRARRDAFERTRSLESRSSTGSSDRFQPPRRMDGGVNIGGPSRYRVVRTLEEDDSSDTDTDMAAESTSSANRWRQSSPIRSPRGVEQRMRLLWREYLSQVVHAQNNVGESSSAPVQSGGESDANADQERVRYRLWLSTMVESLTSFFSQHGINSSDADTAPPTASTSTAQPHPATPPPPPRSSPSTPLLTFVPRVPYPARDAAVAEDSPASPTIARPVENPPWRLPPRILGAAANAPVGAVGSGNGGVGVETFGGLGQQRWNLRRNAESQVSLSAHLTYRIQAWDFCTKDACIPDIQDPHTNIVVPESKIHNDASVDVSADGRFLVTLVPSTSHTGTLISLHSLETSRLGLCLAQVNVDQFVVSVSISPTCNHLLLGLASSRALSVASRDHSLPTLWAQVYQIPTKLFQAQRNPSNSASDIQSQDRLEKKNNLQGMLIHVRDLNQTTDVGLTSLNCIRWIPTAGQGFVLGTNKGHLKVIG